MAGNFRSGRSKKSDESASDSGKTEKPIKPKSLKPEQEWLWKTMVEVLIDDGIVVRGDEVALQHMLDSWGLYSAALRAAEIDPLDKDARLAVTGYWSSFSRAAANFGANRLVRAKLKSKEAKKVGGITPRKR